MKGNDFDFFFNNISIDSIEKSIYFANNLASLSILLAKASFAFLLISMFSYWFQATFNYDKQKLLGKVPVLTMWLANLTLAFMLSIRWLESGHFPLSNLYESLLFLSWSLTGIHIFLEDGLNNREQVAPSLTLGAITSPLSLFTNAFATFSLPQEMQKVTVLVPALQSNWLIMHVSVMIISYAALLSGSLLAIAFLVINFVDNNKIHSINSIGYASESKASFPTGNKDHNSQNFFKSKPESFVINSGNSKRFDNKVNGHEPMKLTCSVTNPSKTTSKRVFVSKDNASNEIMGSTCAKIEENRKHSLNGIQRKSDQGEGLNLSLTCETTLTDFKESKKGQNLTKFLTSQQDVSTDTLDYQASQHTTIPIQVASQIGGGRHGNRTSYGSLLNTLDNLSYRSIGLGFALLTIGILSGAVWANEAWGSYWSWDPKETWAFVTWLVFASYLHTRLSKGWVGKESAFVATFGFAIIWFCYLGVNLFGKGLHSYGWFHEIP